MAELYGREKVCSKGRLRVALSSSSVAYHWFAKVPSNLKSTLNVGVHVQYEVCKCIWQAHCYVKVVHKVWIKCVEKLVVVSPYLRLLLACKKAVLEIKLGIKCRFQTFPAWD